MISRISLHHKLLRRSSSAKVGRFTAGPLQGASDGENWRAKKSAHYIKLLTAENNDMQSPEGPSRGLTFRCACILFAYNANGASLILSRGMQLQDL